MRRSLSLARVVFVCASAGCATAAPAPLPSSRPLALTLEPRVLEGAATATAISHDGTLLATAAPNEMVTLRDLGTGTIQKRLRGRGWCNLHSLVFSAGSRFVALAPAGEDHAAISVWDLDAGGERRELSGHATTVSELAFAPFGTSLVSWAGDGVRTWDAASGEALRWLGFTGGFEFARSPDGELLAFASPRFEDEHAIHLVSVRTGKVLRKLEGNGGPVGFMRFSANAKVLVSASTDDTVRVFDTASGATLQKRMKQNLFPVAISPDGSRVALLSADDALVRLWNTASGQDRILAGHDATVCEDHRRREDGTDRAVTRVAFAPNGRLLASAGRDGTVRLWDPASGQLQRTLAGHGHPVWPILFSPDSRTLLSVAASDAGTRLFLWDTPSGRALGTVVEPAEPESLEFAPDGRVLVWRRRGVAVCLLDVPSH